MPGSRMNFGGPESKGYDTLDKSTIVRVYRTRINQSSTLQPLHYLHGVRCIVIDAGGRTVTIYFTEGAVLSMVVPRESVRVL